MAGDKNLLSEVQAPSVPSNSKSFSNDKIFFNFESERIKSFSGWPINSPVDPERLAKAGLYYSGIGDEAICFSCQGRIGNWNFGDIVLTKHSELFPHCDFINNKSNNIPVVKSSAKEDPKDITKVFGTGIKSFPDFSNMKSESERLKTFIGKWPVSDIDAAEVAHAGFFYLGPDDKVQCPYCKVILSGWESGDDPLQEHTKHYPKCEFFFDFFNKKNSWYQLNSQDICGNMEMCGISEEHKTDSQHANLEKLGVHLHKGPVHPQQSSLSSRLRSFSSWTINSSVSKDILADAGFFYIGMNDRTICFHCNGGLCSWEKGDDPWVEHARWYPNCDFLRLNKGSEFIEKYSKKEESPFENASSSSKSYCTEVIMKKVDEAMKSDVIEHVLETGLFPSYILRAAIFRQVKETGSSFLSIDDLCIAASCLKDEMEKESLKTDHANANYQNISEVIETRNLSENEDKQPETNHCLKLSETQENSSQGIKKNVSEVAAEENTSQDHCLCKICLDKEVSVVFLPCGHLLACTLCAPALKFCPSCRKAIQATVRVYLQ